MLIMDEKGVDDGWMVVWLNDSYFLTLGLSDVLWLCDINIRFII